MSKENKETNLRTLDQKEMGRRVRNRREAKNLSREELAESLGVSPAVRSRYRIRQQRRINKEIISDVSGFRCDGRLSSGRKYLFEG